MNALKTLPIGLGLACAMMMSSCSKDEVQTPAPKVESVNTSSNLKTESMTASISPTKWMEGIDILPASWDRNVAEYPSDAVAYPVGVSSLSKLWGTFPWVQNLYIIPGKMTANTFVTITTGSDWDHLRMSSIKTKINNLIVGKKYSLKVYVATAIPTMNAAFKKAPSYAKSATITVRYGNVSTNATVNLLNTRGVWVEKVITFTALHSSMDFVFTGSTVATGQYSYLHLSVPEYALQQL